jgi:PilZ domain
MLPGNDVQSRQLERRVLKRTRVSRNAKIIVPRRSPVIFCTVKNITGAGACLKLASTFGLPETFDLTFEHGRTRRRCRVIWRTNDRLGVAFIRAAQSADA